MSWSPLQEIIDALPTFNKTTWGKSTSLWLYEWLNLTKL
jgi:hypothetical protein